MRALLGVDALYRAESGDGDGLAVLNMDTEGRYPAERLRGLRGAARARFEALRAEAAALPEADRRLYYDQLCRSTLAFMTLAADGLDPSRRSSPASSTSRRRRPSDAELDALCDDMRPLLDAWATAATSRAQCAAWEERTPRARRTTVPDVLADPPGRGVGPHGGARGGDPGAASPTACAWPGLRRGVQRPLRLPARAPSS